MTPGLAMIDADFRPTGGHQLGIHPGGLTARAGGRSLMRH